MKRPQFDEWPDIRITIEVLPWCWKFRPRFYRDDIKPTWIDIRWLFLGITIMTNRPLFPGREAQ